MSDGPLMPGNKLPGRLYFVRFEYIPSLQNYLTLLLSDLSHFLFWLTQSNKGNRLKSDNNAQYGETSDER